MAIFSSQAAQFPAKSQILLGHRRYEPETFRRLCITMKIDKRE
jgi:hypothetical protein